LGGSGIVRKKAALVDDHRTTAREGNKLRYGASALENRTHLSKPLATIEKSLEIPDAQNDNALVAQSGKAQIARVNKFPVITLTDEFFVRRPCMNRQVNPVRITITP
jgi:hypothetical protein